MTAVQHGLSELAVPFWKAGIKAYPADLPDDINDLIATLTAHGSQTACARCASMSRRPVRLCAGATLKKKRQKKLAQLLPKLGSLAAAPPPKAKVAVTDDATTTDPLYKDEV